MTPTAMTLPSLPALFLSPASALFLLVILQVCVRVKTELTRQLPLQQQMGLEGQPPGQYWWNLPENKRPKTSRPPARPRLLLEFTRLLLSIQLLCFQIIIRGMTVLHIRTTTPTPFRTGLATPSITTEICLMLPFPSLKVLLTLPIWFQEPSLPVSTSFQSLMTMRARQWERPLSLNATLPLLSTLPCLSLIISF